MVSFVSKTYILLRERKVVPWDRHKRQAAEHERKVHDLLHKAG